MYTPVTTNKFDRDLLRISRRNKKLSNIKSIITLLTAGKPLARFRAQPDTRRYTDADQQSRFPGDKGLEYVPSMQDKQIVWGRIPE